MDTRERSADLGPTGLADVRAFPLRELWSLESSTALDESLRRVVDPATRQTRAAVSAFNSAI
jgi:FXSXX-COOH protein